MPANASLSAMDFISDFVHSLQARGCRNETVKLRAYHAARAMKILGSPNTWSKRDVETYLANPDWSPSTRRSVHASLKALCRCVDDLEGAGVMDDIPAPRVPRGVPRPLSDSDIRTALGRADDRTALMVELMAYGGLRRGEVARVQGADVSGQWLRVTGKGGHSRMVPLPPHLAARVKRHGPGWIFPGQISGHLSARRVGELIRECLPAGMTPHQLRHRYATSVYRTSGDIRAVQELLGHARLDTTMVYTAVDSRVTASAAAGAWTLTG